VILTFYGIFYYKFSITLLIQIRNKVSIILQKKWSKILSYKTLDQT